MAGYSSWWLMWYEWGVPTDKIPTEESYNLDNYKDFDLAMWTSDESDTDVQDYLFSRTSSTTELTSELRSMAADAQRDYERRGTPMGDITDIIAGATGGYTTGNPNWWRDLKSNWRQAGEAALSGPGNLLKGIGANLPWWVWGIGIVVGVTFLNSWSGGGVRKLYKD